MKVAFAIALGTFSSMLGANAFVPSTSRTRFAGSRDGSSYLKAASDVENAAPSADVLRNAGLTNASDEIIRLGDYMGKDKSIVVFLRHLG